MSDERVESAVQRSALLDAPRSSVTVPPDRRTYRSALVGDYVGRLRACEFVLRALLRAQMGWLPRIEPWEVRMELSRQVWEDAQSVERLRARLAECTGGRGERPPGAALEAVADELVIAPSLEAFLAGGWSGVKAALLASMRAYAGGAPLGEWPSVDLLRSLMPTLERQVAWAKEWGRNRPAAAREEAEAWRRDLEQLVEASGGFQIYGLPLVDARPTGRRGDRGGGRAAWAAPALPARDGGLFQVYEYDPSHLDWMQSDPRLYAAWVATYYLNEMDAVDMIGSIYSDLPDLPWGVQKDLCRHLWDESRHSLLGQRRLESLGLGLTDIEHRLCSAQVLVSRLAPLQRYAVLTMVFEKRGFARKQRYKADFETLGDRETADLVAYDISDEQMHIELGHRWIEPLARHVGDARPPAEIVSEAEAAMTEQYNDLKQEWNRLRPVNDADRPMRRSLLEYKLGLGPQP